MWAIIQTAYGSPDAFQLKEIGEPDVGDNDVLVRVRAASLGAGDRYAMRGAPYVARFAAGWPEPKGYVPGYDAAGVVEAAGKSVTRLKPGDEVFGEPGRACAEYVSAKEDLFEHKPANLTFDEAAAVPVSGLAALQGLRDVGKVRPGHKVLINGASGGVGTFAVQIAKAMGAEVTGVCSTHNVEMVRSIGADHVIDYTREDFTRGGPRYDVILDNVANHPLSRCRRALAPGGIHVPNSGQAGMGWIIGAFATSLFVRRQGRPSVSMPKRDDLIALKDLIEAGKVTPVIDRTYPLRETPEAFRYLDEGHARGKVVITLDGGQQCA